VTGSVCASVLGVGSEVRSITQEERRKHAVSIIRASIKSLAEMFLLFITGSFNGCFILKLPELPEESSGIVFVFALSAAFFQLFRELCQRIYEKTCHKVSASVD